MPRRPPCHRLAPAAHCWRFPRQLGVTRASTPETRRPTLPPRPLGPGQAQQPLSWCTAAPLGLPRLLTRPRRAPPDRAAHVPQARSPRGGRPENLVYRAGEIPACTRSPFLRKPKRGVGGPRVTSAHRPEGFRARPSALGGRAGAFPRTFGDSGAGRGPRVQEADTVCARSSQLPLCVPHARARTKVTKARCRARRVAPRWPRASLCVRAPGHEGRERPPARCAGLHPKLFSGGKAESGK
ncbi:Protein Daple [Manis pentadactyla]|nr:Protein Daple [Manis pentadactyla]